MRRRKDGADGSAAYLTDCARGADSFGGSPQISGSPSGTSAIPPIVRLHRAESNPPEESELHDEDPPPESSDAPDPGPLPLEAAFRTWSDQDALRRLDVLRRYSFPPMFWVAGYDGPDPWADGHEEWCRRLEPLRQQFEAKLRTGGLVATGFARPLTPESRRSVIPADLFEVLELHYEAAEASFHDLHFLRIEVALPLKREGVSGERSAGDDNPAVQGEPQGAGEEFTCNANYTRISIRNNRYFLSGGLCTVVRLLHHASRSADPWLETKWLLEQAKYGSVSLSAVFRRHADPSWKELIEQRRGYSRLNLQHRDGSHAS